MDAEHDDTMRWLEEGRRFLGRWREELDALVAENERLRADSERLAAFAIENTRLREETARLQAEREELLAAFSRMADLVEQVRRGAGMGYSDMAMPLPPNECRIELVSHGRLALQSSRPAGDSIVKVSRLLRTSSAPLAYAARR
jgi:predicted nuclease with TOPRIM domain